MASVRIWCSSFLWTTPCFHVGTNTLTGGKGKCPSANIRYRSRPVAFRNICWRSWDVFIGHLLFCILLTQRMKHRHQTNKSVSPRRLLALCIWHRCANTWVYLVHNHAWRFWRKLSRGNFRQFVEYSCLVITSGIIVFTDSIMYLQASIKKAPSTITVSSHRCAHFTTHIVQERFLPFKRQ